MATRFRGCFRGNLLYAYIMRSLTGSRASTCHISMLGVVVAEAQRASFRYRGPGGRRRDGARRRRRKPCPSKAGTAEAFKSM